MIILASFFCLWIVFLLFALEIFMLAMILLPIVLVVMTVHILVMVVEATATAAARGSEIALAIVTRPANNDPPPPRWRFAAAYNQDLQLPIFAEMTLLIVGIMTAIVIVL